MYACAFRCFVTNNACTGDVKLTSLRLAKLPLWTILVRRIQRSEDNVGQHVSRTSAMSITV